MKFAVYVGGLLVGAVKGKNRLDVNRLALKFFPDCDSISSAGFYQHPDMVWVSENFALMNRA